MCNTHFPIPELKVSVPRPWGVLHAENHKFLFQNLSYYAKADFAPRSLPTGPHYRLNLQYEAPTEFGCKQTKPKQPVTALENLLPLQVSMQGAEDTLRKNFISPLLFTQPRSEDWKDPQQLLKQALQVQGDLEVAVRHANVPDPVQILRLLSLMDAMAIALTDSALKETCATLKSKLRTVAAHETSQLLNEIKTALESAYWRINATPKRPFSPQPQVPGTANPGPSQVPGTLKTGIPQVPGTANSGLSQVPGTLKTGIPQVPGTANSGPSQVPGTLKTKHSEGAEDGAIVASRGSMIVNEERAGGRGGMIVWCVDKLARILGILGKMRCKRVSSDP